MWSDIDWPQSEDHLLKQRSRILVMRWKRRNAGRVPCFSEDDYYYCIEASGRQDRLYLCVHNHLHWTRSNATRPNGTWRGGCFILPETRTANKVAKIRGKALVSLTISFKCSPTFIVEHPNLWQQNAVQRPLITPSDHVRVRVCETLGLSTSAGAGAEIAHLCNPCFE